LPDDSVGVSEVDGDHALLFFTLSFGVNACKLSDNGGFAIADMTHQPYVPCL
jgi:hypothetical protein